MKIDFDLLKEIVIPNLNNGEGKVSAKMFIDRDLKIMKSILPPKSSQGLHLHENNCEIDYILAGKGTFIIDNKEEILTKDMCHYCPKGSSHIIINKENTNLILLTIDRRIK